MKVVNEYATEYNKDKPDEDGLIFELMKFNLREKWTKNPF